MRVPSTGAWGASLGTLAVALGLAVITGCGDSSQAQSGTGGAAKQNASGQEPEEDAIAIKVGAVERGSLSSVYATSATLRADKRATVTARTKGVIRQLLVEEGDWVKKDQPLAILENDEQQIAFDQASAAHEIKRRELERAESLLSEELLSEEDYETTRREAVEAQQAAALAELTLSRTVIRATFDGRVLIRHVDVGATIGDGTPVYDIADLDPLYADVQVPERQVAQLKPGQTVRLVTDDDSGLGVAEIQRIAPAVDPSTGTVKVTLAVRRAEGLRPGSFVRVGIVTDTHEDALIVPRSALVAEGRRWHLFRIKDDDTGRVELIEVTRGYEEAERVEILEDQSAQRPLRPGDRVVVAGASALDDGSPVQVLSEADAEEDREDAAAEQEEEAQGVAA